MNMRTMALLGALVSALALAACGKQGHLTPVPPRHAPVKPAQAAVAPAPESMLKLPPQSQPSRVDDGSGNAQKRADDRFNLPPPSER